MSEAQNDPGDGHSDPPKADVAMEDAPAMPTIVDGQTTINSENEAVAHDSIAGVSSSTTCLHPH